MRPAMSSAKNADTPSSRKYSASTRPAIVEARSGKRGGMPSFAADHEDDEAAEGQNGGGAREAHRAHDREPVPPVLGVVVVAVEQHLIDRAAHLAGRRVDQREAQIARAVIDAEEIARDAAAGREHHDARRVRELLDLRVPDVPE